MLIVFNTVLSMYEINGIYRTMSSAYSNAPAYEQPTF